MISIFLSKMFKPLIVTLLPMCNTLSKQCICQLSNPNTTTNHFCQHFFTINAPVQYFYNNPPSLSILQAPDPKVCCTRNYPCPTNDLPWGRNGHFLEPHNYYHFELKTPHNPPPGHTSRKLNTVIFLRSSVETHHCIENKHSLFRPPNQI